MLSTAEDRLLVGNAVDHGDAAVEVLLMHSVSADSDGADRHWQVEPPAAQCMLLALGRPPGDTGADNMVVFVDGTAPVAAPAHMDARMLAVP